jgi:hypothetical protein
VHPDVIFVTVPEGPQAVGEGLHLKVALQSTNSQILHPVSCSTRDYTVSAKASVLRRKLKSLWRPSWSVELSLWLLE